MLSPPFCVALVIFWSSCLGHTTIHGGEPKLLVTTIVVLVDLLLWPGIQASHNNNCHIGCVVITRNQTPCGTNKGCCGVDLSSIGRVVNES